MGGKKEIGDSTRHLKPTPSPSQREGRASSVGFFRVEREPPPTPPKEGRANSEGILENIAARMALQELSVNFPCCH